jgi:hypothetical protein
LELGEFHADHLHRGLRDFGQVHSVWKMNHRAPVNLRVVDLNSVLMVVMKVCLNQDVQGVRNYLVDLNFRDALPCAYSLISIEIYFA